MIWVRNKKKISHSNVENPILSGPLNSDNILREFELQSTISIFLNFSGSQPYSEEKQQYIESK